MSNIQTYKFIFSAEIGTFNMKAKVSSPLFVTWKRSQQSAKSQVVQMTEGKADFQKQVLKLPINMYFEKAAQSFQQKKSSFSFTMNTPKGQKVAGVVYIDLSKMLNNKLEQLQDDYVLEKCPVKDSKVHIRITSECVGQKSNDTMSQASMIRSQISLPVMSSISILEEQQKKQTHSQDTKDKQIKSLKQKVQILTKINKRLQKQLQQTKAAVKGDSLKQQLIKSKTLQDKLEQQVHHLRKQNVEHEKQLETVRSKLQQVYQNMYDNLSSHFI